METQFLTQLKTDPPIVQNATFRYDKPDRKYIDDQIRAVQQSVVGSLYDDGSKVAVAKVGTVATVAALRSTPGSQNQVVHLEGYTSSSNFGHGDFVWKIGTPPTDDGGTNFQVAGVTTGWWQRRFSGALNPEWFGVVPDANIVEDGVMTVGSNILTSATANFTAADVGKTILIDAASNPAAGTATTTAGSRFITGTGTAWLTDFAAQYGVYLSSEGPNAMGAFLVLADNQMYMNWPATNSTSGVVLYRKIQQLATITSVISATQVHTSFTAVANQTLLRFSYGNDQTTAMARAIAAAIAQKRSIEFGPGRFGFTTNQSFVNAHGIKISGAGMTVTEIVALIPYDSAVAVAPNYGLLSFRSSSDIEVSDMTINYSCPFVPIVNSATLGMKATYFNSAPNCRVHRVRAIRCRDEAIYCDSEPSTNWHVSHCIVDTVNNGINMNSGGTGAEGLVIDHNTIRCLGGNPILASSKGGTVIGNDISGPQPDGLGLHVKPCGADLLTIETAGRMLIANNTFRDADTTNAGVSAIKMFGATADATSVISVLNNTFTNISADWTDGPAAAISASVSGGGTHGVQGVLNIQGNTFRKCKSGSTGGKFVHIDGADTAFVTVTNNFFNADSDSNMTVGVDLDANVPEGAVFAHGNRFSPVTTTFYDPKVIVTDDSRYAWLGDSNTSITVAGGNRYVVAPNTQTANRTDTLGTAGAVTDEEITIDREDRTAFTRAIANGGAGGGTLYTFPASKQRRSKFRFDGTNWALLTTEAI